MRLLYLKLMKYIGFDENVASWQDEFKSNF